MSLCSVYVLERFRGQRRQQQQQEEKSYCHLLDARLYLYLFGSQFN